MSTMRQSAAIGAIVVGAGLLSGCAGDVSQPEEEVSSTSQAIGGVACMEATKAAGGAAGGAVGGAAGRWAGAAIGGALGGPFAPLTGAIGGVVGGFVGKWIGKKVGKEVGEVIGKEVVGPECAKAFWGAVAAHIRDDKGWRITAAYLQKSANGDQSKIGKDDNAVEQIKASPEFRAFLAQNVNGPTVSAKGHVQFSGDLSVAYDKNDFYVIGTQDPATQIYDLDVNFKSQFSMNFQLLPKESQDMMTYLGNNAAALDQSKGFIKPFDIEFQFHMTYEK